jgi:hypothetical protein
MGIPSLEYFYNDNPWINAGPLGNAVERGPLQLLMTLNAFKSIQRTGELCHINLGLTQLIGKRGVFLDIKAAKKKKIVVKSIACIHTNADT